MNINTIISGILIVGGSLGVIIIGFKVLKMELQDRKEARKRSQRA